VKLTFRIPPPSVVYTKVLAVMIGLRLTLCKSDRVETSNSSRKIQIMHNDNNYCYTLNYIWTVCSGKYFEFIEETSLETTFGRGSCSSTREINAKR